MSLLKKVGRAFKRVASSPLVAGALTAFPATTGFGVALSAAQRLRSGGAGFMPELTPVGARTMPGAGPGFGAGRGLSTLPAIGFGLGVAAGRARSIARGAAALCIKHPQWCSTIGGVAAVGAMMESGQLPIPKRRRGRGLTPRDLRSFRRVARLIRVFAPTVRRIPHRALHVRGTGITHA